MLGKKWKPKYVTDEVEAVDNARSEGDAVMDGKLKKKKANRQLSTKGRPISPLRDVV